MDTGRPSPGPVVLVAVTVVGVEPTTWRPDRARIAAHTTRLSTSGPHSNPTAGDTTTVRVRRGDAERLQALAKRRETTVIDVVHSAVEALERQEFLRGMSGDYRRLREDPAQWEAYLAERQEWDAIS